MIPESLPLFQQPWQIVPETQVTQLFPDSIAFFPASHFDSTPSVPDVITHNSLDPPPLTLLQDKGIPVTQEADCQSSS